MQTNLIILRGYISCSRHQVKVLYCKSGAYLIDGGQRFGDVFFGIVLMEVEADILLQYLCHICGEGILHVMVAFVFRCCPGITAVAEGFVLLRPGAHVRCGTVVFSNGQSLCLEGFAEGVLVAGDPVGVYSRRENQ